jgi:NAD(P)-dependent dehydrogenase (short-subunit alcohol dehydrogenase family)
MAAAVSHGSGGVIDLQLQGSAGVVTGAGSGIGEAAVRLIGAAGAAVVLVGRRAELLRQVASAIERDAGRALCVPADVADPASPAQVIDSALEAFGQLDGLVNNTAVCRNLPVAQWRVAGFDEHLATNIRAPYQLIQAALPSLRESALKSVVNISSSSGILRPSGQSVYQMTKCALDYLTQSLAGELAPDRIRVNCIAWPDRHPDPHHPGRRPGGGLPVAEEPGAAGPDRRPGRDRAVDRAAAEPGVVVPDRRGDPGGRRPGDSAFLRPGAAQGAR